jgi:hypothetical protein
MVVHVKIISGFNVGREFEFSADQRQITIGRAADADVRLHEDDRNCGRGIHARIVCEDGLWFVEADHGNGVVLAREGKTLTVARGARSALGRNARLTLGTNGPQIRVALRGGDSEELAPTLKNNEQVIDMPVGELTQELADAAANARPGLRRLARVVAIGLALTALLGGAAIVRSELARRSTARLGAALDAQLRAQRSEVQSEVTALKGSIASLDERVRNDLVEVLRRAEPSVLMLALSDGRRGVRFVGTGWTVGERLIATNAHVAIALREGAGEHGKPIARRATADGIRDIGIESIDAHPGYATWSKILTDPTMRMRSGASAGGAASVSSETLITPYDVAVLRADADCGKPLPLASVEEIRALRAGEEMGYVGYPAENVFDPRTSPPALLTGRVIRLTDFFYNPVAGETAVLVHHNLPTVGGASGSPILNRAGRVVAINSAGSFVGAVASVQATRLARIPVGFNYGQSVEFLRECLDGTAPQALGARNDPWQEKLRRFALPAGQVLDGLAAQTLAGLRGREGAARAARWITESEQVRALDAHRGAGEVFRVELPAKATVLIQACADDRSDIDLELAADESFTRIVAQDSSPDAYPQVGFVTSASGPYWIRVRAAAQTILERPSVTLRVSRLGE